MYHQVLLDLNGAKIRALSVRKIDNVSSAFLPEFALISGHEEAEKKRRWKTTASFSYRSVG